MVFGKDTNEWPDLDKLTGTLAEAVAVSAGVISRRQLLLIEAKLEFENAATRAKESVAKLTGALRLLADETERSALKNIDNLAAKRRAESDDMAAKLTCIHPEMLNLWTPNHYSGSMDETEVKAKLTGLQKAADDILNDVDQSAVKVLKVVPDTSLKTLLKLNTALSLQTSAEADQLGLRIVDTHPDEIQLEVGVPSMQKLSQVLLPDLYVKVSSATEPGLRLFGPVNFKDLLRSKLLTYHQNNIVRLTCPFNHDIFGQIKANSEGAEKCRDVLLEVELVHSHVRGSPLMVTLQKNFWEDIGQGEMTRTGKAITDLDESDRRAMDYSHSKLYTVHERSIANSPESLQKTFKTPFQEIVDANTPLNANKTFVGHANLGPGLVADVDGGLSTNAASILSSTMNKANTSKNVSFNPQTKILQMNNHSDILCETQPFKMGSMDVNSDGMVQTGDTKTQDGSLSLCKSLSQVPNNPSMSTDMIWENSDDYEKQILEDIGQGNNDSNHARVHEVTMWEDADRLPWLIKKPWKRPPDFDLKSSRLYFTMTKSFDLCTSVPGQVSLPTSIARDPILDRIYVSDAGANVVHMFQGWEYRGQWPPSATLITPRYVLCIPDETNPASKMGLDVAILDHGSLQLYGPYGQLKKKLLFKEASNYRGLAYYPDMGRVITTEMTTKGVYLVFMNFDTTEKIVDRMLLEPTCAGEYQLNKTKCRHLCARDGLVYTTDFGLGCFYITDLRDRKTTSVYYDNGDKLGSILGIGLDPAGNVLVTTVDDGPKRGSVQLFTAHGVYIKRLHQIEIEHPSALLLDSRNLFLADVASKTIQGYNLVEKPASPIKLTQ